MLQAPGFDWVNPWRWGMTRCTSSAKLACCGRGGKDVVLWTGSRKSEARGWKLEKVPGKLPDTKHRGIHEGVGCVKKQLSVDERIVFFLPQEHLLVDQGSCSRNRWWRTLPTIYSARTATMIRFELPRRVEGGRAPNQAIGELTAFTSHEPEQPCIGGGDSAGFVASHWRSRQYNFTANLRATTTMAILPLRRKKALTHGSFNPFPRAPDCAGF